MLLKSIKYIHTDTHVDNDIHQNIYICQELYTHTYTYVGFFPPKMKFFKFQGLSVCRNKMLICSSSDFCIVWF